MQISKLLSTFGLAALCASLPAVQAADNPAQAAARQALAQKLFETGAQSETSPPAAVQPVKPHQPDATPVEISAIPAGVVGDNPAQAAARQALAAKLFETGAQQPAVQSAPAAKPKAKAESAAAAAPTELPPILSPASPLPPTKEARLQILLEQYKADLISPEAYHKQRAAILERP